VVGLFSQHPLPVANVFPTTSEPSIVGGQVFVGAAARVAANVDVVVAAATSAVAANANSKSLGRRPSRLRFLFDEPRLMSASL
jgi:hypothetical protein